MVQVKIMTNTNRVTDVVEETMTPKQILDAKDIDYATCTVLLDGVALDVEQMNSSLSDMGITEKCFLAAIVKANNA